MRTAAELAAAIPGGVVKESTIQNVEAGRKAELTVSQLLNIALALRLPPAYLLAPIGTPLGSLDLANLSEEFNTMTVIEFEAWLSGNQLGAYTVTSASEHRDRNQLLAMRELDSLLRERIRLRRTIRLENELQTAHADHEISSLRTESQARLEGTDRRVGELANFLESAGWDMTRWKI
jgi:transcriptional regulator with XRE-family HTH domain